MKNKIVIQDYLFSSALVLKSIAVYITWYACYRDAGIVYERNPITRFLLGNDLAFVLAELASFAIICLGYSRIRGKCLPAGKKRAGCWSLNAVVGFVFLLFLWDAANDAIILLETFRL